MKRRGFLGFMGGAAVAGPSALKKAAEDMVGLSRSAALSPGVGGFGALEYGPQPGDANALTGFLREHKLLGRIRNLTVDQRNELLRRTWVDRLDPDLASYASFSLSAKIALQRERNVDTRLAHRKGWLERVIAVGSYEDDLDNI